MVYATSVKSRTEQPFITVWSIAILPRHARSADISCVIRRLRARSDSPPQSSGVVGAFAILSGAIKYSSGVHYMILSKIPRVLFLTCWLFVVVLSSAPVQCQEFSGPDTVQISTPLYRVSAGAFLPPYGTYSYDISWQGIPAASAMITCEPVGQYLRVVATAQTAKGVDLLYKLRYRAEALLSSADFLPYRTTISQTENSRQKYTQIGFENDGQVFSFRQTVGEESKELRFNPGNFMLEPFSAAFVARGLEWNLGDTKQFDTFNGKSRYLISLTDVEEGELEINGERRPVFVLQPQVINLTNNKQSKKLRRALIYISRDSKREILKLESSVFIGTVKASLDSYQPAPSELLQMAQARPEIFLK